MILNQQKRNKILCDTDFLISLNITNESTHEQALEIFYANQDAQFYVLNLTMYELATVLSRKFTPADAKMALQAAQTNFPDVIWFEQAWQEEVWSMYGSFEKKNMSFFDCACLYVADKLNARIASFDAFYLDRLII